MRETNSRAPRRLPVSSVHAREARVHKKLEVRLCDLLAFALRGGGPSNVWRVARSVQRVARSVWRVACNVWRVACGAWRVAYGVCLVWPCGAWLVAVWCVACGAWRVVQGVTLTSLPRAFFI